MIIVNIVKLLYHLSHSQVSAGISLRGASSIPLTHPGSQRGGRVTGHAVGCRLEIQKEIFTQYFLYFTFITRTTHSSTRDPPQASWPEESRIATIQGNSPSQARLSDDDPVDTIFVFPLLMMTEIDFSPI